MNLRLLLALPLVALAGCSSGYFHLTHPAFWRKADQVETAGPADQHRPMTDKEKAARRKQLTASIKEQQKIINQYQKQDAANKTPDPLYFVSDLEFAEAKARLAKAQAELKGLLD
ncbi:MAG TPA: hypothetical protein VG936_03190 [Lacunisphaera sp.]|nr:hypothetical protein [Lacunisphaera sp.]